MRANPIVTALSAAVFGFFIGISFPVQITPQLQCGLLPCSSGDGANYSFSGSSMIGILWSPFRNTTILSNGTSENPALTKPKGTEKLPPGLVVTESDLHMRRLWGSPREDVATGKYLLALAVGYSEKANVNATVLKFSDKFDVVLFHYDGRTTEWDDLEWSKQAVHVSAKKQTKWWFAKRFLHPSIVAPYEYIFLWDEDLGVDNFTAEEYVKVAKKNGLEISQPGLDSTRGKKTYEVTVRRNDGREMHKTNEGGRCPDVHQRPCSGFVEVMAPVFSREAWTCVWHMIQNDLVHGWGLDFNFWRCVDNPEEQIGIVDAQYVSHHGVPTLIAQGNGEQQGSSEKVRARQWAEMRTFHDRISNAEKKLGDSSQALEEYHP
ncbi:uncharacterized protein LOC127777197 [Oryza glaberrima]|uniref:uncharacterized protein LOC127777197 n=1 Tax=Oryza glaberrima TaxID=4538 RepID=UPI00224BFC3D|nr:uncharacterized protein LOC127777197 [Oryza glaberrima]XP_052159703.1 uncharacterized protein LOC127777197 [Oryza glaberrima]XP_052159704.1 uncharacterized protein LOC127777197 [Oryza glaberrima]